MKGLVALAQGTARLGQRLVRWLHGVRSSLGRGAIPEAAVAEPQVSLPSYQTLAQGADFPVLRPSELIEVLELQPRIDAIRQLLGLPSADWELLGQNAIERVAEAVQLCPASEVHHHAFAGGLLVHTLEVAEHALRLRKRYQLPIGAGAEAINEAGPRWTYAVFAAALLHDPGKLVAGIQVRVGADGLRWTPLDQPLARDLRYRVTFASVPYRLHAQASLALFSTLLPTEARRWLGNDAALLEQLLATTYSASAPEGGAIAEILRQADGASVRSDLGQNGSGPLASALAVPLVDRLMGAVRRLIADGELKVNAPGAQIWVSSSKRRGNGADREAWVLCKSLADAVITRLRDEGDTSVPSSNERIFDTLQEHQMLRATREGNAVWHVRVRLEDWSCDFRVLRFPAWRLWPPGRIPPAKAKVRVLKSDRAEPAPNARKSATAIAMAGDTLQTAHLHEPVPVTQALAASEEHPSPTSIALAQPADESEAELIQLLMGDKPSRKAKAGAMRELARTDPSPSNKALAMPETAASAITGSASDELPFLKWLRTGIADGSIAVNSDSAFVHGGEDCLLLVSPRVFREYATQCGGDWTAAQASLNACAQVRRSGKRTVLPFVVHKSGAQINCVVIEQPRRLGFTEVSCNSLLEPMHR